MNEWLFLERPTWHARFSQVGLSPCPVSTWLVVSQGHYGLTLWYIGGFTWLFWVAPGLHWLRFGEQVYWRKAWTVRKGVLTPIGFIDRDGQCGKAASSVHSAVNSRLSMINAWLIMLYLDSSGVLHSRPGRNWGGTTFRFMLYTYKMGFPHMVGPLINLACWALMVKFCSGLDSGFWAKDCT